MESFSCFGVANTQAVLFQRIALSEGVPDGLCHSLSVDLSNAAWAQRRLINKLSGNTFGTRPSDSVKIGAGPSYGTIFGTVPKIRTINSANSSITHMCVSVCLPVYVLYHSKVLGHPKKFISHPKSVIFD